MKYNGAEQSGLDHLAVSGLRDSGDIGIVVRFLLAQPN